MTTSDLSIEMLPARHGDALWVEWGAAGERHRMLVDGGPAATFEVLRDRFLGLSPGDRVVDLMVVTHIDLDHIDGAIRLLRDRSLGVSFSDVWFNDYRHLSDEPPTRGALQGEFLSAVLVENNLVWNEAFGGGPVVVPPTGSLPAVNLPGGLRLVLVSPTPEKLQDLRGGWEKTLREAEMEPGDREEALARLEDRLGPAERGGERKTYGGDRSKANGSSIGLIVEYGDERWLLAGDAHEDTLLAGLVRYGEEVGEFPVRLDGFKLPHHGSVRNVSPALLDGIDCRRFLVSTNGSYFGHPDEACLDLVLRTARHPELVFNYQTEFTARWDRPSEAFSATYLDRDSDVPPDQRPQTETGTELEPTPPAAPEATVERVGSSAEPDLEDTIPDGPRGQLQISVHHGGLDRSDHPVLVGHYQATRLSGAERFVDRRFNGRLSDRLARDNYPGRIGDSVLIRAPRRRQPGRGALVIGLGEYGELTPLRLVQTVRVALIRHALNEADRHEGQGPAELGIGTVLIGGTGDQGLSISGSVRAIVDAILEANRDLRAGRNAPRAQYRYLQFWEHGAPEAELAFRAVDLLQNERHNAPDSSPVDEIVSRENLEVAEGRLMTSLPVDTGERTWWRIGVCEVGATSPGPYLELEFTVGGPLARTGKVTHKVERRRLERLLQGAVGSTSPGAGLHTTLFELVFPNQLKWDLLAAQDIQLEVDDLTADIPWELLAARNPDQGERGELALRAPLIRQLRLPELPAIRRATRPMALVIGNPPIGRLADPLAGAYAEALAVQEVLSNGHYSVKGLCHGVEETASTATTMAIETALFEQDYRIIHIAAHGLYQPDDPTRTGVAIGPDDFITASVFGQLNVTPDIVFLNCCHLGGVALAVDSGAVEFTRKNLNRLGASLARQLIDSGVRAVVVAGWAVHDTAAEEFARTFYQRMLGGRTFGHAVHQARLAARDKAPEHSTWGAYQCYGDTGYRLPRDSKRKTSSEGPKAPLTVREAIRRLEGLVSEIESIGVEADRGPVREWAEEELSVLEETACSDRKGWLDKSSGQLCEEFARAWAALGEFDLAIEWYERALTDRDGLMTLHGVEQLANLQDRLAAAIVRDQEATDADWQRADGLTERSLRTIGLLEELSGSGERAALRAGHFKRRATATTGEARAAAVRRSTEAYLASYLEDEDNPYPLINYVQLEEIRSRLDGEPAATSKVADQFAAVLEDQDVVSSGSFWSAVARPNGRLAEAIKDDAVGQRRAELLDLYRYAFDNRSTATQRGSAVDHLLDLAELHPDDAQATALRSLHDELRDEV